MNKKEKLPIYIPFMLIFIIFAAYNFIKKSQWFYDNLFAMLLLTAVFFVSSWFMIGKKEFFALNLFMVVHNLGTFGFYTWGNSIISYDNLIHFLGALVSAYILFNFVLQKLHIRQHKKVRFTVIDEHKAIMVLLVISLVIMLGTFVEVSEFFGFMYLGFGDGMFFTGAGDTDKTKDDIASQYVDTMEDIMINIIGAFAGVLLYYRIDYKKRPSLKKNI